jgi:tRNA 2-thiouridine synthesizing protein A
MGGRRFLRIALDDTRLKSSFAPMSETVLDLRGLRCPLPALKTRKALTRLAAGDRLVVECTDPLSTLDIPNLISQTGDVLEGAENQPGLFVFRIQKA